MRQFLLRSRAVGLAAALAALLLPAAAGATAITYSGAGTILVTATVNSQVVASGSVNLASGSQLVFDAGVPQLVSLSFTGNANQGPYALTLPVSYAPYNDYDQIVINSLSITGGPGFTTNLGSGTNPYNVTVAPLTVSGTASLTDLESPFLTNVVGAYFGIPGGTLSGQVTVLGGGGITLKGIELGTLDLDGPGGLDPIRLKGDVTFSGTLVPEPATALLFGLGLGALALARRSRRS